VRLADPNGGAVPSDAIVTPVTHLNAGYTGARTHDTRCMHARRTLHAHVTCAHGTAHRVHVQASGALYGLLVAGHEGAVVSLERSKQQPPLDTADLLLLSNFVACNGAVRCACGHDGHDGRMHAARTHASHACCRASSIFARAPLPRSPPLPRLLDPRVGALARDPTSAACFAVVSTRLGGRACGRARMHACMGQGEVERSRAIPSLTSRAAPPMHAWDPVAQERAWGGVHAGLSAQL
jgi:hypothetical protein